MLNLQEADFKFYTQTVRKSKSNCGLTPIKYLGSDKDKKKTPLASFGTLARSVVKFGFEVIEDIGVIKIPRKKCQACFTFIIFLHYDLNKFGIIMNAAALWTLYTGMVENLRKSFFSLDSKKISKSQVCYPGYS